MLGERDPFEFVLAEKLSRSVAELRTTMSQLEFLEWQAYYDVVAAEIELERKRAQSRARS